MNRRMSYRSAVMDRWLCMLLTVVVSMAGSRVTVSSQTYYYKRIKVVSPDGERSVNDDAHFITFTGSVCYDSDKNGDGVENKSMRYLKTENGLSVYYGDSFYGQGSHCFSNADKSRLNIRRDDKVYVYVRIAESSCDAVKRVYHHAASVDLTSGVSVSSGNPAGIRQTTKRKCPGCGGKGRLPDQITWTADYTNESVWCDKCRSWGSPHVHHEPLCPVCHGRKEID